MLIVLPSILLITSSIIIRILDYQKVHIGILWLLSVVGSVGALLVIGIIKWIEPGPLIFSMLNFDVFEGYQIIFKFDQFSWPYAIGITGLLASIVFTSSGELNESFHPTIWSNFLSITAVCIIVISASTPLALIISWSILDISELFIMIQISKDNKQIQRVIISYVLKTVGTFILLFAMVFNIQNLVIMDFVNLTGNTGLVVLLSICLRLGVLPIYIPYARKLEIQRGLLTILRLVIPATNLVILARMSETAVPYIYAPTLLLFASMAALFGSFMWLVARDELRGQSFWMIAFAGITIACVIRGKPYNSLPWGIAMLLCGGLLSLYSIRNWLLSVFIFIGFVNLSGIPFTLTSSGWEGIIIAPFNLMDIIILVSIVLLLTGYLHCIFKPGDKFIGKENWIKITYPFGLILILLTIIFESYLGWTNSFDLGMIWPGLLSLTISLLLIVVVYLLRRFLSRNLMKSTSRNPVITNIRPLMLNILELRWLLNILEYLYRFFQRMIVFVTEILEGDGGVIWSFLFLIIIITVISSRIFI